MTQRKWLAECHAWLDDPASVQFLEPGTANNWQTPRNADPVTCTHLEWRIKPATITINGTELPKPAEKHGVFWLYITAGNAGNGKVESTYRWDTREDCDAVYNKLVEILS